MDRLDALAWLPGECQGPTAAELARGDYSRLSPLAGTLAAYAAACPTRAWLGHVSAILRDEYGASEIVAWRGIGQTYQTIVWLAGYQTRIAYDETAATFEVSDTRDPAHVWAAGIPAYDEPATTAAAIWDAFASA